MNRLKRELVNRGIIYTCDNPSGYDQYESEEQLVAVTDDYIITCYYCNVLEPQLKLYDRNFNLIGQQSTEKDDDFFGSKARNPWMVSVAEEDDDMIKREQLVEELKQLSLNPYEEHKQKYEINGHVIDFSYSERLMYAVLVDQGIYQVHPRQMRETCVRDMYGEWLTETQFILKKLELPYKDIEQ